VVKTRAGSRFDCSAICASRVETVGALKVAPVFPSPRGHARLRLPAASRPVSWVPWASVPHASGSETLRPRCLRYYALLRLPSSVPAGSLLAPDRYLGLTRFSACPSQLAPGSARSPSASSGKRQGVVFAGHPCSGCCSQGDGRSSRVPGLPLWWCPVPLALARAGLLPSIRCNCRLWVRLPGLILCPPLYIFRDSIPRPASSPYLCFAHRLSTIALRFGYRPGG